MNVSLFIRGKFTWKFHNAKYQAKSDKKVFTANNKISAGNLLCLSKLKQQKTVDVLF